jgi:CheY-like chemotaxis protein
MNSPSASAADTYTVSCFSCLQPFDAFQTSWCNCLVTRRSLVCPSCLVCFCKASQLYKQKFWEVAPKALWDKAAAEHKAPEALPGNPDPGAVKRPLVLVVDDEEDIQRMAAVAVEILGFGVIRAGNGEEGLELAARYKPDLILSDAFMPKLDGREMCRRIKSDPETAGVKVVIMTSLYTASRYKYEAFKEFQADDYLSKPLEFGALQELVRKHLGGSGS